MKTKEGYVNDLREWMVLRNYSAATVSVYTGVYSRLRQSVSGRG
ncbi:MAG: hypothetical protein R2795_05770 [Saprospiraceae bacterium]